jgi:hypothetical protein
MRTIFRSPGHDRPEDLVREQQDACGQPVGEQSDQKGGHPNGLDVPENQDDSNGSHRVEHRRHRVLDGHVPGVLVRHSLLSSSLFTSFFAAVKKVVQRLYKKNNFLQHFF